ncbi:MAG TPA: hypothetical protein VKR55_14580, partial [Bradyrhizobium sp.]|uniref:hypothetical protein n=1 Tax=Bradyrhizobium sp. TaxID=376 RepID=UPI002BBC1E0A
IVFYPRRKQADLVPALAALECVIRHKPNRTSIAGNAEFLPSLDGQIILLLFIRNVKGLWLKYFASVFRKCMIG